MLRYTAFNSAHASLIADDLLLRSLGNNDSSARIAIASQLLDGGADINRVIRKFVTPLETLAAEFKFRDDTSHRCTTSCSLAMTSTYRRRASTTGRCMQTSRSGEALIGRMDEYLRDR